MAEVKKPEKDIDLITSANLEDKVRIVKTSGESRSIKVKDLFKDLPTGIYATDLPNTLAMPEDVGGIEAGTTVAELEGKTYDKLLDDVFFPTVEAIIQSNEKVNITGATLSGNVEIGTSFNLNLVASLDKGTILNGDKVTTVNKVGIAKKYLFKTIGGSWVDNGMINTKNISGIIVENENQVYGAKIDFDEETDSYYDNKGNVETGFDRGPGTAIKEVSINGRYNILTQDFTVLNPVYLIDDGTGTMVLDKTKFDSHLIEDGDTLNITTLSTVRTFMIAHPKSWGNLTSFEKFEMNLWVDYLSKVLATKIEKEYIQPDGTYVTYYVYYNETLADGGTDLRLTF